MYKNIPTEMKLLPQWVVCGSNKQPIDPKTGYSASVTNPQTWGTYEQAVQAEYKHIGFVLSDTDPYAIIDLDYTTNPEFAARQQEIIRVFDSYTERSQSKKGWHIVVKGYAKGCRRDKVEVYSKSRFMICTGDITHNKAIAQRSELLSKLTKQMQPIDGVDLEEKASLLTDVEVSDMALNAVNSAKYTRLCNGEISDYPSQSEADFALLSMLCFYTRNNEQVRRLFRYSALGKREKAVKDNVYIDRCLRKIRSVQNPEVDIEQLKQTASKVKEEQAKKEAVVAANKTEFAFPPGLLGEVCQYIYASATRPVPEIALAGALTFFSGLFGRQYNISGTGLNLYTILLARTGTGKEGAANGINRLYKALRQKTPGLENYRGAASYASAPALAKSLVKKPCQFAVLGEFGIFLKDMCSPKAFGATVMLKRALLDIYHKSGWGSVLLGTEYSDKEKNTGMVAAPCLTLLGESTQETFLEGLSEAMIQDGLLPRFLFIEYSGKRPYLNPNMGFPPSEQLVTKLSTAILGMLQMSNNNVCVNVDYTNEARQIADAFEKKTTDLINASAGSVVVDIWNRAHLKAIKIASLIAIGNNPGNPVITTVDINWAIALVKKDTEVLLARIKAGDIGNGDSKMLATLRKVISEFFTNKPSKGYRISREMYKAGFIPYNYFLKRVRNRQEFSSHRLGIGKALEGAIQILIDTGELLVIDKLYLQKNFDTTVKCFGLGKGWLQSE